MPKKAQSGEKACPACREPCSVDAIICPHCRTVFTQAQIEERKQEVKQEEQTKNKKTAIGCVGLIGIIALIAMCSPSTERDAKVASLPAAKSTGDAKQDAIAIYKAVISATADCDISSKKMADAMQGGDMVFAYRTANTAEDSCLGTGSQIRKIKVADSIQGEHREAAEKALEACDTAYVMKWSGARKLKAIIDGDSSPSSLADFQETTELVQTGQMMCSGGLVVLATSLGASEADLGIADKSAK